MVHSTIHSVRPRLLFLVSGRDVPSTRYRILPYIPLLRSAGYRCEVAYSVPEKYGEFRLLGWRLSQWLKRATRRWHLLKSRIREYDVIIIERELFDLPDWNFEAAFRQQTRRLVLDVDDAIFLRYPEKFAALSSMADLIFAGNRNLLEHCIQWNSTVELLPTAVDQEHFDQQPDRSPTSRPVIGWIGTASNLPYLAAILPVFEELASTDEFLLRIITGDAEPPEPFRAAKIPIEFQKWNARSAVAEIARFSIGVMPLLDNPWEHYKCGFKLLQYLATGVPAVASPVGVNAEIVQHGETGLLAHSPEQWLTALQQLVRNPELRVKLGDAGRERARQAYSTAVTFPVMEQALRKLLNEK